MSKTLGLILSIVSNIYKFLWTNAILFVPLIVKTQDSGDESKIEWKLIRCWSKVLFSKGSIFFYFFFNNTREFCYPDLRCNLSWTSMNLSKFLFMDPKRIYFLQPNWWYVLDYGVYSQLLEPNSSPWISLEK